MKRGRCSSTTSNNSPQPPTWNNPYIGAVQALTRGRPIPAQQRALTLLTTLATSVRWIMHAHGWRIKTLREFLPQNDRLLGTNLNRGLVVSLRLRRGEEVWLEEEEVMGTLLHELVHNHVSEHNNAFYALLGRLEEEWYRVKRQGYLSFGGAGRLLGPPIPSSSSGLVSGSSSSKGSQSRDPFPGKGRKLGDGRSANARLQRHRAPQQMAADAAERRLRDDIVCGQRHAYFVETDSDEVEFIGAFAVSDETLGIIVLSDEDERTSRRNPMSFEPSSVASSSTTTLPIPKAKEADGMWTCRHCPSTSNSPLQLFCSTCGEEVD